MYNLFAKYYSEIDLRCLPLRICPILFYNFQDFFSSNITIS